jgi:Ca2+-binding RTX toxin-like protein
MTIVTDYTALVSGFAWAGIEVPAAPRFLTFSFPLAAPAGHDDPSVIGAAAGTFQALDAAEQALAREALAAWGDASGLTFLEVGEGRGDITFAWYDFTGTAYGGFGGFAYFPAGSLSSLTTPFFATHNALAGDVFLDAPYAQGDAALTLDLLLHELGHAIGLKHPFEATPNHPEVLDPALDITTNTVMSYTGPLVAALGPLDLDAVAALYGDAAADGTQVASFAWDAATETLTQVGFAAADIVQGVSVADAITGRGGADLLIALAGNDTVDGGGGADTLLGGDGRDVLRGGAGDDWIEGGAGKDRLSGGKDQDVLFGGGGEDRFLFGAGFGEDSIADFADGEDLIDLRDAPGIDAIGDLTILSGGSLVALVYVGTPAVNEGLIIVFGVDAVNLTAADFLL